MSDAAPVFEAIKSKFGTCIIHAISTPNVTEFFGDLPFNIHSTSQGISFDGAERLHIAAIEYGDGYVVMIGGHLTENDHHSIYRTAHRAGCDAEALIPFELRAGIQSGQELDVWLRAVRQLESDGITISSDGKLVR